MDAKTIKTPDTLPWIPPGKPKDESFNKFVHKKGSIASRINAEVSHSYSPKLGNWHAPSEFIGSKHVLEAKTVEALLRNN